MPVQRAMSAGLGLPLPAGLIATVAGTLVADGDLDAVLTLLIALVACMLGDRVRSTLE